MTDPIRNWQLQTSTGRHFDVLDGIRGVAILMVMAFHTFYTNPNAGALSRAVGKALGAGWMGVPIFFVLSGFLIALPFFRAKEREPGAWYVRSYARRRLAKVLPPFYLSLVVLGAYYFWKHADIRYVHTALEYAVGLPNFRPISVPFFNSVYWSLIVEVQFYLILPFLFLAVRKLDLHGATGCLCLVLFVTPWLARQAGWHSETLHLPADDGAYRSAVALLMNRFPGALDHFAWGVAFAGIYVSLPQDRSPELSQLGYGGLLLLGFSMWLWSSSSDACQISERPSVWSVEVFRILPCLAAFLMLFFLKDDRCSGSRWLAHPALRFTGLISYELFLFHYPIVYAFHAYFGRSQGSLLLYAMKTILPLILCFGFSAAVYKYFSLPIMSRVRQSRKSVVPSYIP